MKQEDAFYMRAALAEAAQAYALGEVPIGAVLVDEAGEIVARGHNLRERDHDATAHAEMIAIRAACERLGRWRLSGLTLYVTIEPCPMCAAAISAARVARVYAQRLKSHAHSPIPKSPSFPKFIPCAVTP